MGGCSEPQQQTHGVYWGDASSTREEEQRQHGGPTAGTVRWGSWCCESGRRQSENGYFTTPGSHPTPGSTPSSSPHAASTSAIGHRWGTGKPPRTTAGGFPADASCCADTTANTGAQRRFLPRRRQLHFEMKGTPGSIGFLQRKWSHQLPTDKPCEGPSRPSVCYTLPSWVM
ncbi:hypothetical protein CapIbe_018652 [Capra ibex]